MINNCPICGKPARYVKDVTDNTGMLRQKGKYGKSVAFHLACLESIKRGEKDILSSVYGEQHYEER